MLQIAVFFTIPLNMERFTDPLEKLPNTEKMYPRCTQEKVPKNGKKAGKKETGKVTEKSHKARK